MAFVPCTPLSTFPFAPRSSFLPNKLHASPPSLHSSSRRHVANTPGMLQQPDHDGPPGLEELRRSREATSKLEGPPLLMGTARVTIDDHPDPTSEDAVSSAATAAIAKALASLGDTAPSVVHLTSSTDLPAGTIIAAVSAALPSAVPVLGRSVRKVGTVRTIEVLALAGGSACSFASATEPVAKYAGDVRAAAAAATRQATEAAVEQCPQPAFAIFVSSQGDEAMSRATVASVVGETVPAYGGAATGGEDGEFPASVLVNDTASSADGFIEQTCGIVLLKGAITFLISAVVKSWAQPAYVETLPFLIPNYVGDPATDLLTAIRHNDYDKFVQCFEVEGVDINHSWGKWGRQSPLLASVSRGRVKMTEYLLARGANPSYRNIGGYNPIMYTNRMLKYDKDLVNLLQKMLQDAGADINDTAVILPDDIA